MSQLNGKLPLDGAKPTYGWCVIKNIETEETYSGSRIVIPDASRMDMARDQAELVYCGGGSWCDDEDCDRPHSGSRYIKEGGEFLGQYPTKLRQHTTHPMLIRESWVLTAPRARLAIPGYFGYFLIAMDDLWAILEP